jgi:2-amino-4-hydroxy-6-hydroxymethyldihydropteridine diphosphokinase
VRRYFLSLGSNIEPARNLIAAVRMLRSLGEVIAISPVYISPPFGTDDPQPDYLNAVLIIDTDREPGDFQEQVVRVIETRLGRERGDDRFAPRTIDIDILMVDREILEIDHRRIPSPEILERSFVAVPLAEIAPDTVHPEDGRTMAEIAAGFVERLRVSDLSLTKDP